MRKATRLDANNGLVSTLSLAMGAAGAASDNPAVFRVWNSSSNFDIWHRTIDRRITGMVKTFSIDLASETCYARLYPGAVRQATEAFYF